MSGEDAVQRFEFATGDVLRAHEAIRDTFAGHRLLIRGSQEDFRYRQTTATAGDLSVDSLLHTTCVREEVDPIDAVWVGLVAGGRFQVGHAREQVSGTAGEVLLFPQGVDFTCEWRLMDLRVVRLPAAQVARRAAEVAGVDPRDFRFHGLTPISPALGRYCANTIGYVRSLFAGDDATIAEPLVRAAALDSVAAAVLATFPYSATDDEAARSVDHGTPASVRRALELIEARAHEPLTLHAIAEGARVGPRALQEAFRRHRDTTPMAHLRETRLDRAHRELLAADPTGGTTVASVAARWGFGHRGRFAEEYRRRFGRNPQQTLLS
ncbi:helix-turn-helix transcriptional regulator [Blastococcus sp. TML/M2B]|uniref:helix-turn-helix transcriptional regulator n=1 Tax=unclassified Blastococcus TaxID=2619396 RepID=UPI00190AE99C|nr:MULTISPECIES: helix-turn-helix transcriptional regulator [unclassified Blastococcus]MBN1091515.1 helix-turn-helix transcriptional regulator [Blastococcus sp. TML/M2B]MBN1094936.1 helix-turn-helix transcriptional regulator [Blastococcus sp. TML/C7B]